MTLFFEASIKNNGEIEKTEDLSCDSYDPYIQNSIARAVFIGPCYGGVLCAENDYVKVIY